MTSFLFSFIGTNIILLPPMISLEFNESNKNNELISSRKYLNVVYANLFFINQMKVIVINLALTFSLYIIMRL